METVILEKALRLRYINSIKMPWDDAVTLVLTYAEIYLLLPFMMKRC
jgi:hypothetical protein